MKHLARFAFHHREKTAKQNKKRGQEGPDDVVRQGQAANHRKVAPHRTVEVPFWPPCFYWSFWSCFGSHDEAGLLAFEALQGLPRPARGTHGRSYCGRNRLWGRQHVAGTAAKLGCAFSHSAERIVDELGLLYPENRGNLQKNMASV